MSEEREQPVTLWHVMVYLLLLQKAYAEAEQTAADIASALDHTAAGITHHTSSPEPELDQLRPSFPADYTGEWTPDAGPPAADFHFCNP